jgi:peptide chain release factor 3
MDQKTINEIKRRRTFAIISHPDAGKTTMTEKLLLYGGAIHLAGTVKGRKAGRHATSDWMEIEKQRGISVTSSVMQFEYDDFCINILDTPGHQDFSEDTYRTLCAADAAVMLIDGAKGVEAQTIKLFAVCRMRGIPIFTFVNKMDRASKDPFDLLDELEKVLGIHSTPMNWPIGTDGDFKGVYNRTKKQLELFDASSGHHGSKRVGTRDVSLEDPSIKALLGEFHQNQLISEIELLNIAGNPFDEETFLRGEQTPVYFGSAITNFGVEPFLKDFLAMAPPPASRSVKGVDISPESDFFSGFVFKIQANMNPDHRDRMAFIRICSGKYEKGLAVKNSRDGKTLKLNLPQQFMAQERTLVEEAYAGDIIGVFDPGVFQIGDSLASNNKTVKFEGIPIFPPEHFARVYVKDSMKRKQFLKGIEQLSLEGAIQLYKQPDIGTETYLIGVVGVLQLEVLEHRLKSEYNVGITLDSLNYRYARWVRFANDAKNKDLKSLVITSTSLPVLDSKQNPVVLFESEWGINWALDRNPGLIFDEIHEVSNESGV